MTDFTGKLCLITGGATGIGLATAQLLAARGARIAILDRDSDAAQAAARVLGEDHIGIGCDVTNEAGVSQAVANLGPIDVAINNAGVGDVNKASLDQDMDHIRRVLDIHIAGGFVVAREAARGMIASGKGGAIVNLASIAGITGLPRRNAYGAAKAGLIAMTRSLACEWAGHGIRVNAVAPGYVATDLVRKLVADGLLDEDRIKRRTPMGRLIAPAEIAQAIVFLASDAASAITGTTLTVDAGWSAYGAAEDIVTAKATD